MLIWNWIMFNWPEIADVSFWNMFLKTEDWKINPENNEARSVYKEIGFVYHELSKTPDTITGKVTVISI
jgi:hypothetical protein